MVNMGLSNKLRILMLDAGLSQKDLALNTRIERSTLTKILNGSTTSPRIETIYTLSKYFNVDISELLDGSFEETSNIATTGSIKDTLKKLMEVSGIKTINSLSKNTGVPSSVISDILMGKSRNPNVKNLQPIADFFNITIAQLTGYIAIENCRNTNLSQVSKTIPLLLLEQVESWESSEIYSPDHYIKVNIHTIGRRSFAIKFADNKYSPEFLPNESAVVDKDKTPETGDLVVAIVNEKISLYEYTSQDDLIWMREIGTYQNIKVKKSTMLVYGVIIQKSINQKIY